MPNFFSELEKIRQQHLVVTLVTGVFDVLHEKHRQFLLDAKALGGYLVVGIESDVRVKNLKGDDRPYFPQDRREQQLRELHIADDICILPENFDEPEVREAFMTALRPNFLAVSSHSLHQERKSALVEKYGGELRVVTAYDPHFSSTQRIQELRSTQSNRP